MVSSKDSRQKLIISATKLFAHKGFEGASTREIASLAGCNISMIKYYFDGKEGLYRAIIDDLIEKQNQYASTFMDITKNPSKMSKQEQIDLLFKILDKFIDFFYSSISSDLILLLLKEQQNPNWNIKIPVFDYVRKLIGAVFNIENNNREIVYQMLFIISQINSPKVFPAFSLRLLNQVDFEEEDIEIVRKNIKFYINSLLKEKGIA